jgi:hypothetical protein
MNPSTPVLSPPYTTPTHVLEHFKQRGFVALNAASVRQCVGCDAAELARVAAFWNDLPPDQYLKDGGHYRRRRHSSWVADAEEVIQVSHRAHWQPLSYNALHGGMKRWFEPLDPQLAQSAALERILKCLVHWADLLRGPRFWFIEVHAFRIDTADGIGRPTPEGAHRDGVDLVAVFMLQRHQIKGGESRVFEANGPHGQRFTLNEPWSMLLLDDHKVIHESTPIQPESANELGWRDTLVITLRTEGFLEAP